MKKRWERPSLQVIIRNKPEEAILAACRNFIKPGGSNETHGDCIRKTISCGACASSEGS